MLVPRDGIPLARSTVDSGSEIIAGMRKRAGWSTGARVGEGGWSPFGGQYAVPDIGVR
jgi:hypothetical protein